MKISPLGYSGGNFTSVTQPGVAITVNAQGVSAIDVRALLFDMLPQIESTHFRVFRDSENYTREMIITSCAQRKDHATRNLHSLVMRAEVLGSIFHLDVNSLRRIPAEKQGGAGG